VRRGQRVVHGGKELLEKLGRNDLCPCGSGRENLIQTLRDALQPLAYIHGAWLGGSAAFGKLNDFSDIDLFAVVSDDALDLAFTSIEDALQACSPIAIRYQIPNTIGFQQRVYSFQDAPEFLVVEAALIPRSSPNRFLERELHGDPGTLPPPERRSPPGSASMLAMT
jgi:predicted nucleotidyltransferase